MKKPSIRAIVIDSQHRRVMEEFIPNTLEALQQKVGGLIELVEVSAKDDLFVNENFLAEDYATGFVVIGYPQPMLGNGVIVGHDSEGNATDASLSLAAVQQCVIFLNR